METKWNLGRRERENLAVSLEGQCVCTCPLRTLAILFLDQLQRGLHQLRALQKGCDQAILSPTTGRLN